MRRRSRSSRAFGRTTRRRGTRGGPSSSVYMARATRGSALRVWPTSCGRGRRARSAAWHTTRVGMVRLRLRLPTLTVQARRSSTSRRPTSRSTSCPTTSSGSYGRSFQIVRRVRRWCSWVTRWCAVDADEKVLTGQGGAVVAHACGRVQKEVADVLGVVILDVVEGAPSAIDRTDEPGSAMEALQHMRGMIASRPTSFTSVSEAIQWQCVAATP